MFAISFRRLYYVCDKVVVRNLRSRRLGPPNPGLQNRIDAFRDEGLKIEDNDAEEFVEQSESDFYKVGEAYSEHLNETLMGKFELRHHVIKDKYFKENMPNLLTWSEKEQIRHLALTHPDEWTAEKIAESFPITVPVVKKLLKYPWKPASEERIARHDASAMRNWRELKEGTLKISEDLRKHFLKFSERTIPPLNKKSIKKIDITKEENLGEFESIIRKCATKAETNQSNENHDNNETALVHQSSETENHNKAIRKHSTRVTLDELTAKIEKRLEKGNVDLPDQIILNTVKNAAFKTNSKEINKDIELFSQEGTEKDLTEYKPKVQDAIESVDYPERIRIPKKAYKRGATYKVNDCYYDDDGKFIYRVLGMSNTSS